jgi:hypothetical protein
LRMTRLVGEWADGTRRAGRARLLFGVFVMTAKTHGTVATSRMSITGANETLAERGGRMEVNEAGGAGEVVRLDESEDVERGQVEQRDAGAEGTQTEVKENGRKHDEIRGEMREGAEQEKEATATVTEEEPASEEPPRSPHADPFTTVPLRLSDSIPTILSLGSYGPASDDDLGERWRLCRNAGEYADVVTTALQRIGAYIQLLELRRRFLQRQQRTLAFAIGRREVWVPTGVVRLAELEVAVMGRMASARAWREVRGYLTGVVMGYLDDAEYWEGVGREARRVSQEGRRTVEDVDWAVEVVETVVRADEAVLEGCLMHAERRAWDAVGGEGGRGWGG